MIRVFVVSPLPAVRAGLAALIGAAKNRQVIGQANTLGPPNEQLLQTGLDVLVLDAQHGVELATLLQLEAGTASPPALPLPTPSATSSIVASRSPRSGSPSGSGRLVP